MSKWVKKLFYWLFVLKCPTCGSRRLHFDRFGTFPGCTFIPHNFYRCLKCGSELIEYDDTVVITTETLQKILKTPAIWKEFVEASHKVPWRDKD